MTYLVFAYFLALSLPLFIRSWRLALGGLCIQALVLATVLWLRGVPEAFDLIPANLFTWTLAAILIMIAFAFSATVLGDYSRSIMHLGVACCGLLCALLIFATQRTPLGQAIAALTLENGLVLFELLAHHHAEWPVQLGFALVYLLTILTLALLVRRLGAVDHTPPQPADSAIL